MKTRILLGAMLAALMPAAVIGAVSPAGAPVASVDLSKFDCRTLLHMEGDDRDRAVLFLHGYVSAQKRQTVIELAPLAEATDKIIDFCIDHPTAVALTVFTNNR
jgi:hypothetical protein